MQKDWVLTKDCRWWRRTAPTLSESVWVLLVLLRLAWDPDSTQLVLEIQYTNTTNATDYLDS